MTSENQIAADAETAGTYDVIGIGVQTAVLDGFRVWPESRKSSTVLAGHVGELERLEVPIEVNCEVTGDNAVFGKGARQLVKAVVTIFSQHCGSRWRFNDICNVRSDARLMMHVLTQNPVLTSSFESYFKSERQAAIFCVNIQAFMGSSQPLQLPTLEGLLLPVAPPERTLHGSGSPPLAWTDRSGQPTTDSEQATPRGVGAPIQGIAASGGLHEPISVPCPDRPSAHHIHELPPPTLAIDALAASGRLWRALAAAAREYGGAKELIGEEPSGITISDR